MTSMRPSFRLDVYVISLGFFSIALRHNNVAGHEFVSAFNTGVIYATVAVMWTRLFVAGREAMLHDLGNFDYAVRYTAIFMLVAWFVWVIYSVATHELNSSGFLLEMLKGFLHPLGAISVLFLIQKNEPPRKRIRRLVDATKNLFRKTVAVSSPA